MLQSPGISLNASSRMEPSPMECNPLLKNALGCFTRSIGEAPRNAHPPLAERATAVSADAANASRQFMSLQTALRVASSAEDVNKVFQGLNAFVEAAGANQPEIAQLREEIKQKLALAQGLQGSLLEDLNVDIFVLFLKLLALLNKQQEQEKLSRQYERDLQTKYMEKVASNFETQGKWLLNTCIGSGVMSILSGICPILQHSSAGTSLHGMLPSFLKSDTKAEDFFKAMGKMTNAGSEISKNSGQVHSTYSEGWRTKDHHKSEHAKMLGEDETRNVEDARQYFTNIVNALNQKMQSDKDLDNQLLR
jgi:hypothetical protein